MSDTEIKANWRVYFSSKAGKQKRFLPSAAAEQVARLMGDIERQGPIRKEWALAL